MGLTGRRIRNHPFCLLRTSVGLATGIPGGLFRNRFCHQGLKSPA